MKKIILILAVVTLFSCEKKETVDCDCGNIIDKEVVSHIINTPTGQIVIPYEWRVEVSFIGCDPQAETFLVSEGAFPSYSINDRYCR